MLSVTTCCIYKSTSYIYLFNNCKEKCTFSTRPRILRDQISHEILVGIVIFLCLSKIYPSSFTWSKLHFKSQDKTVSIRSWIFHILAILLRTSQVNNVWFLKLLWPWTCHKSHLFDHNLNRVKNLQRTTYFGEWYCSLYKWDLLELAYSLIIRNLDAASLWGLVASIARKFQWVNPPAIFS